MFVYFNLIDSYMVNIVKSILDVWVLVCLFYLYSVAQPIWVEGHNWDYEQRIEVDHSVYKGYIAPECAIYRLGTKGWVVVDNSCPQS